MIKRLRIVFITVTMFLVAVMLVSIFGSMIFSTQVDLQSTSLQVLQDLDRDSFRSPWPDFPEPLPQNCFILTLHVDGSMEITAGYADIPDTITQKRILEKARSSHKQHDILYVPYNLH